MSRTAYLAAAALLFMAGVATGAAANRALDPGRVAPHIYQNIFENERVRVFETRIRNGEMAPLHDHPDRLVVYLSGLDKNSDGKVSPEEFAEHQAEMQSRHRGPRQ